MCRKQFSSLLDRVLIKSHTQTCQHFMHYECAQKIECCPVCKLEKVSIIARDDEARQQMDEMNAKQNVDAGNNTQIQTRAKQYKALS